MALEDEANDAAELPDRLLFLSGHYEGWSLRLDRGPVLIGDYKACTLRLNPFLFDGTRLMISRVQVPGGVTTFDVINQGSRAIINGKVRAYRCRMAHGDTVTIPSSDPDGEAVRFRLVVEGREDEEGILPELIPCGS